MLHSDINNLLAVSGAFLRSAPDIPSTRPSALPRVGLGNRDAEIGDTTTSDGLAGVARRHQGHETGQSPVFVLRRPPDAVRRACPRDGQLTMSANVQMIGGIALPRGAHLGTFAPGQSHPQPALVFDATFPADGVGSPIRSPGRSPRAGCRPTLSGSRTPSRSSWPPSGHWPSQPGRQTPSRRPRPAQRLSPSRRPDRLRIGQPTRNVTEPAAVAIADVAAAASRGPQPWATGSQ